MFFVLFSSVLVESYYKILSNGVACKDIDYESVEYKQLTNFGLSPIIDIRTNKPIKQPVGCE